MTAFTLLPSLVQKARSTVWAEDWGRRQLAYPINKLQ